MLICSHTLLYRATSELRLVPWMHWYFELASLLKPAPSSGLLCVVMLLLKDAPWYACLRAKCTSKLGALLGLWPGQQSCQLEFWNLCQVETSQNVIVKRSNKMVSLSGIIAKPLEIVRSEANLTTTPLEPLWRGARAWICRSYWQDTVGTWRCPVALAVTWNDLATLKYFTRLNSAQIGQVDCFFAAGCIAPGSSVLRIFLRILFRTWDIFTGNPDLQFPHPIWDLLSAGANFQYPRKISTDVALIAPWAHPLAARRRALVWQWERNNLWTWTPLKTNWIPRQLQNQVILHQTRATHFGKQCFHHQNHQKIHREPFR